MGKLLSQSRWKWIFVALAFLTIVGLGARYGLQCVEERSRENAGSSLTAVVDTTQDSLREWYRAEREWRVGYSRFNG